MKFVSFSVGIAVIGALLSTGCSKSVTQGAMTRSASGMTVVMSTVPTPLRTGDNVLSLTLTDSATGAPIPNANIGVTVVMTAPRLPGDGAMVTGRSQGNGHYDVPVKLAVATSYEADIRIERTPLPPVDVIFPLEATQ